MTVPTLIDLSHDSIIGYARYSLSQQVTAPDDSWLPKVSGEVIDTPNEDHFRMGWVNDGGDWTRATGAIAEETMEGDQTTRAYREYAKAWRVTRKERNRGLVSQVQRNIDNISVGYGRLWAILVIDAMIDAAKATPTDPTISNGIDNVSLFNNSHTDPTGDNKHNFTIASTANGPTDPEMEKILWDMVEKIRSHTDNHGRGIHENQTDFVVFAGPKLQRQLAYAVKAQAILEGGQSRTNLLATAGGLNFHIVTTLRLSAWGLTQLAMFAANGRSFFRARDPQSLMIETEDKGISKRATTFASFEERLAGAWDWQSAVHYTLVT